MAGRGLRVVVADAIGIILLVCSALVGRALFHALGAQWDFLAESSGMAALVAWGVVWAMCRGAFFVLLAASFAYAVGRFRQRRIAAAIPLLFNVGVLLVATFYPFTSKWIDTRFEDHFSEYTAVVALVEDGTLAPGPNSDTIALPANLAHLSAGGEIRVDTAEA